MNNGDVSIDRGVFLLAYWRHWRVVSARAELEKNILLRNFLALLSK